MRWQYKSNEQRIDQHLDTQTEGNMPMSNEGGHMEIKTSKDIDGNDVKVDDRLLCINAKDSFHRLTAGVVYTAEAAHNDDPVVIVERAYHSIDRFRLVTA